MPSALDATKLPSHGIFYMEGVGGYPDRDFADQSNSAFSEREPSCFAFEEERGGQWAGAGAAGPSIKDRRPTL
jgi:hypothetical protein